jgi:hypothetical protein
MFSAAIPAHDPEGGKCGQPWGETRRFAVFIHLVQPVARKTLKVALPFV